MKQQIQINIVLNPDWSHGTCPHCGASLGPPGTIHVCS